jgi:hypothetical protein
MEKFKDLRRQLENVRRLIEVATSAGAGGLVGLAQGQIPFGGLYKPELGMDSGSYELGHGLGMLIGGIETTLTGGKLLAAGGAGELTLGGTGVGALGSGVLVVGGVVFTAGGAVNVLEALKATSNGWSMMKSNGQAGDSSAAKGAGEEGLYLRGTKAGLRLHGEIPSKEGLRARSNEDLVELREMTQTSLQTREREMAQLGAKGGHGPRIGEERRLLDGITEILNGRGIP